ncbi:MAG: hypothetical protein HY720_17040 [Planctomycetes bacterium]|nr:hypothetical protein [Planctomycetota bacterium]
MVPIRNVYYMLCYAWEYLEGRSLIDTAPLLGDRVEDLLASVLVGGVARLLRRGLSREYVERAEELRSPRGRIDVSLTVKRKLEHRGLVSCVTDDLSHDVLHNRLLKGTVERLADAGVDPRLRAGLLALAKRMTGVSSTRPSVAAFRRVVLHRNTAHYRFLLRVCELATRQFFVEPGTGATRFHDFRADERRMGLLFQRFIRNFLRHEQGVFQVGAERIPWDCGHTGADAEWLPVMNTDISLWSAAQKVVIETEFYEQPIQLGAWQGRAKIRSDHLYQVFAYLKNLEAKGGVGRDVVGVLLYAAAGLHLDLRYRLGGHQVVVRTLDLDQPWEAIRASLLGLIDFLGQPDMQLLAPA